MRVLDEFRQQIDTEVREIHLSPEQIKETIESENNFFKVTEQRPQNGLQPVRPVLSKDHLRELLGMQRIAGREDIPLKIRPSIGMNTQRNSNVFGRRTDAVGETTFSYYPGVKATARWAGWDGKTDYTMTRLLHRNFTQNDRVEQEISQSFSTVISKTTWDFVSQYSLAGTDTELEIEKPVRYVAQSNSATVAMPLTSKLGVGLGYTLGSRSFLSDLTNVANSRTQAYDLSLSYDLTAKTHLTGGYAYRTSRPPKGVNSDNIDFQDFYAGVSGKFANKLIYKTLVTYKYSKLNLETVPLKGALSYDATLTYLYTPKLKLDLIVQSALVPTLNETTSDARNDVFGLDVSFQLNREMSISGGQSVRLIQSPSGPATFEDPDYPGSIVMVSGHDVVWSTTVGLNYNMGKSAKLHLDYARTDQDSTLKLKEHTNHMWEVGYDKAF